MNSYNAQRSQHPGGRMTTKSWPEGTFKQAVLGLESTNQAELLYCHSPFQIVSAHNLIGNFFRTNISEDPNPSIHSTRGCLVSAYLSSSHRVSHDEYIHTLETSLEKFAGFNLLLLDPQSDGDVTSYNATLLSNNGGGNPIVSQKLPLELRRLGGMSNGILEDLEWEKVHLGKDHFAQAVFGDHPFQNEEDLITKLLSVLKMKSSSPLEHRSELRKWIYIDPMRVSVPSPKNPLVYDYGTRLSSILLVRKDGSFLFLERDRWELNEQGLCEGGPDAERRVEFRFHD